MNPICEYCGRTNLDHSETCNGCGAPLVVVQKPNVYEALFTNGIMSEEDVRRIADFYTMPQRNTLPKTKWITYKNWQIGNWRT